MCGLLNEFKDGGFVGEVGTPWEFHALNDGDVTVGGEVLREEVRRFLDGQSEILNLLFDAIAIPADDGWTAEG